MLAMCVRKTADSGAPTIQSHGVAPPTSKRNHKRVLKGRVKEERREETERTVAVKVRDDEEGHLIYQKGDQLESRCTCTES